MIEQTQHPGHEISNGVDRDNDSSFTFCLGTYLKIEHGNVAEWLWRKFQVLVGKTARVRIPPLSTSFGLLFLSLLPPKIL